MRKPFYKFYWKVQGLIVPGLLISQYPYKNTLKNYINENTQWLDLGCGHQLLPSFMPSSEEEVFSMIESIKMIVGIDYCYDSLQKHRTIKYKNIGDIENLPFKDNSFNLITANMVVEHIENPTPALGEVFRILKPKGIFIFHTTNLLNYQTFLAFLIPDLVKNKLIEFLEGRKETDVFPAYYRMNSRKKIKQLAQKSGFNVLELKLINSVPKTIMLGPVVIIELLIIRVLKLKLFENFRSNIITVFQKINLPN